MACPPIHTIVEHGRVTLTGVVNNQVERMLAFSLAQVDGVFDVKNQLRVDRQLKGHASGSARSRTWHDGTVVASANTAEPVLTHRIRMA